MKIFAPAVQEQLTKIATVAHTDLNMVKHLDSSTDYICALLVNKYKLGDPMVGGSTIEIREDINTDSRCYKISWWHRGEKCKGEIVIYNDSYSFPLVSGDLTLGYLFD